ncbi:MAG: hypothetical protein RLZZ230_252 [Candidatus Parcubacteria bacterium]|jgi:DNA primase
MIMFSEEFIDCLLVRADIVDVINNYISLKKSGTTFRCLCPFHTETKPSFVVYPSTQSYICYGCGASGNAIKFLMAIDHLDFTATVNQLCQLYDIPVRRIGKKDNPYLETERKKFVRKRKRDRQAR